MDLPNVIVDRSIEYGTILHSAMFKDIDYGKFFVIIGVRKDYVAGFFFINSNINHYLMNKQEQLNMQFGIKKSDYSFLKHDSFISASSLQIIPSEILTSSIQNEVTTYIDKLHEEHLNELLEAARPSKLFSKKEKQDFSFSLQVLLQYVFFKSCIANTSK
jgi:hypothetical protein